MAKEKDSLGTKDCHSCRGVGRFNVGAPQSRFPTLDFLGFGEEVCNTCGGSGKMAESPEEQNRGWKHGMAGRTIPANASGSFQIGYHRGERERRRIGGQPWAQGMK